MPPTQPNSALSSRPGSEGSEMERDEAYMNYSSCNIVLLLIRSERLQCTLDHWIERASLGKRHYLKRETSDRRTLSYCDVNFFSQKSPKKRHKLGRNNEDCMLRSRKRMQHSGGWSSPRHAVCSPLMVVVRILIYLHLNIFTERMIGSVMCFY